MPRTPYFFAGVLFLLTIFMAFFFSATVFFLGGVMNCCIFPAAVIVSAVIVYRMMGGGNRRVLTLVQSVLFMVLAAVACSFICDNSYDGNFYHQEGLVEIYKGWNPYREPYTTGSIWVNHYAKMLEIVAASVMSVTGNLESGKLVNVLLVASSLLIPAGVIAKAFPQMSARRRWIVAVLFAANSVSVAQVFTYYNDYALYCCLLIVMSMFLLIYRCGGGLHAWILASVATMIAMGTKFTHFFYVGTAWICFIPLLFAKSRRKDMWRCVAFGAVSLLVGGVLLNWHPYVTNAIGYGHPLYPLVGGDVDIMIYNTPEMYVGNNRFLNFVKSLLSSGIRGEWTCPLIPLHPIDLMTLNTDCRVNGFGHFFGLMLLVGISLLVAYCRNRAVWYVVLCLIAGCFVFEQSWWARYVPFIWAVPAIAVLFVMARTSGVKRWAVYGRRLIIVCALVTAVVIAAISIRTKIAVYGYQQMICDVVGDRPVKVYFADAKAFRYKLEATGIEYVETPRSGLDPDFTLSLYGVNYFERVPLIELSPDDYREVTAPGWRNRLFRVSWHRMKGCGE